MIIELWKEIIKLMFIVDELEFMRYFRDDFEKIEKENVR